MKNSWNKPRDKTFKKIKAGKHWINRKFTPMKNIRNSKKCEWKRLNE